MNSSSNRFVSSVLSVFATAGLVAMASPARAASFDADAPRQTIVQVSDLNLGAEAGRTTFERRLAAAAHRVCDTQLPGVANVDTACSAKVMTQARREAGLDRTISNG